MSIRDTGSQGEGFAYFTWHRLMWPDMDYVCIKYTYCWRRWEGDWR